MQVLLIIKFIKISISPKFIEEVFQKFLKISLIIHQKKFSYGYTSFYPV